MLSEEEEEDEDESEMEHKSRALKEAPKVGDHLDNLSPANHRNNEVAPRTQVFSGSSDEWTD